MPEEKTFQVTLIDANPDESDRVVTINAQIFDAREGFLGFYTDVVRTDGQVTSSRLVVAFNSFRVKEFRQVVE